MPPTTCPPDFPLGVYETLQAVVQTLDAAGLDYCVGGAVAMYTYGYVRATTDVDFFLDGDERDDVLAAMKKSFRLREEDPSQTMAFLPKYAGTKIHADLLFTWSEPEMSGILSPVTRSIGGVMVPVMPLDLVVISKVTAGGFKSRQDIGALYSMGLFKPERISRKMRELEVPYQEEFAEIMESIHALKVNPRPKGRV